MNSTKHWLLLITFTASSHNEYREKAGGVQHCGWIMHMGWQYSMCQPMAAWESSDFVSLDKTSWIVSGLVEDIVMKLAPSPILWLYSAVHNCPPLLMFSTLVSIVGVNINGWSGRLWSVWAQARVRTKLHNDAFNYARTTQEDLSIKTTKSELSQAATGWAKGGCLFMCIGHVQCLTPPWENRERWHVGVVHRHDHAVRYAWMWDESFCSKIG